MTPGGSSVSSLAGIAAMVDTEAETTSIEISESDDSLSVGAPASASLPSLPQHDPYTPRKRRDPDYVPYYVTNFEYILRCVIDCTDDRNLFNSQEIGIFCFSLPSLFVKLTHIFTVFYKINHSLSSSEKTLYNLAYRHRRIFYHSLHCTTRVSDPDSHGSALILVAWIR
jgi:hypothetical protein